MTDDKEKTHSPNRWGFVTGLVSLAIFAITYVTIGFPSLLVHVIMLPVIIGLLVRWQIKRIYTSPYRDD